MTDILVKFCSSCGTPNRGTRFCAACGALAAVEQTAPVASVEIAPEPAAEPVPENVSADQAGNAARPWSEPTRAVPLTWGGYSPRLAAAYGLISLGTTASYFLSRSSSSGLAILAILIGFLLTAAGFVVLPGKLGLRLGGGALAAVGGILLAFNPGSLFGLFAAFPLVSGWFMARQRPGISYVFLIVSALVSVGSLFVPGPIPVLLLGVLAAIWLGRWVAPAASRARARRLMAAPQVQGSDHTNTMALLALVFGLVGGTGIPIVLGHVALAQIRRTGESGRGLAIAGLVLGYVGVGGLVVVGIVALFLAGRS